MEFTYRIIRSDRRTVALRIEDGQLTVRAPRRMSESDIALFVEKHTDWINKHLELARKRERELSDLPPLTDAEIEELARRAMEVIPERVAFYSRLIGVSYGTITIRNQRTRWGSCSSKGNLNFNCLLMLAPLEVLDSVIVHELCHIKEMNHSAAFYAEILKVFPHYHEYHAWLKEHGPALMKRMTG